MKNNNLSTSPQISNKIISHFPNSELKSQKVFTSISKNFLFKNHFKFLKFTHEIIGLQEIKEKIKEIINSLMINKI